MITLRAHDGATLKSDAFDLEQEKRLSAFAKANPSHGLGELVITIALWANLYTQLSAAEVRRRFGSVTYYEPPPDDVDMSRYGWLGSQVAPDKRRCWRCREAITGQPRFTTAPHSGRQVAVHANDCTQEITE